MVIIKRKSRQIDKVNITEAKHAALLTVLFFPLDSHDNYVNYTNCVLHYSDKRIPKTL